MSVVNSLADTAELAGLKSIIFLFLRYSFRSGLISPSLAKAAFRIPRLLASVSTRGYENMGRSPVGQIIQSDPAAANIALDPICSC